METRRHYRDDDDDDADNGKYVRDDASVASMASMMVRNQAIEDMRARVEKQLKALSEGSDLNALQKQVAELRTTTQSKSALPASGSYAMSSLGPDTIVGNTAAAAPAPLINDVDVDDIADGGGDASSKYVEGLNLVDPYGDAGTYTGEVSLNTTKPFGLGTMKYKDGRMFSGGWNHGQWHGKGTAVFGNGDKFDGTYDLDRRHGFGVYEWKDGRVYEGEFHHDQRQGCGEYRWPDKAIYRGEFAGGHREGEGTYTFADGSTYTGEWSKGRYHGVGQCVWKDGRIYKGEWKEGKAHGYGVEKRANGSIRHEGMWDKDNPVRKR